MMTVEEGEKLGASFPLRAIGVGLGNKLVVPFDIKGSNVRSFSRRDDTFICEGVVVPAPLNFTEHLVLSEFTANLLGYLNPGPGIICAVYSKPELHRSWGVYVGCTQGAVVSGNAFYYGCVVLHLVPGAVEKKAGA